MTPAAKNILISKVISIQDDALLQSIAQLIADAERGRYWIVINRTRNNYLIQYVIAGVKKHIGSAETKEQAKKLCDRHAEQFAYETIASSL